MVSIVGDARDLSAADFPRRYRILFFDPPWRYNDRRLIRKDGGVARFGIGTQRRYGSLSLSDLASIPLPDIAAPRCHVYLWATAPLLDVAFDLMSSWRTPRGDPVFKYVTIAFVWVKLNKGIYSKMAASWSHLSARLPYTFAEALEHLIFFGTGFYTASNAELVLLFRRGRPFKHGKDRKARQVVLAPRIGDHSTKPEDPQDRTAFMYPTVTERLEMFARRTKPGWDVFGNDPALNLSAQT